MIRIFIFGGLITWTGCTKVKVAPSAVPPQTQQAKSNPPIQEKKYFKQIQFVDGPSDTEAEFPIRFSVRIVDQDNKVVEDHSSAPVTVTIKDSPPEGSRIFLTGASTVIAEKGQAEFKDLAIELPGQGYTLSASSMGIDGTSKPFNITPPQPRDVTLVFNGKSKIVRFVPPNTLIDKDGEKFPVYVRNLGTLNYNGKYFKIEIISPTEVHVTEIR